MKKYRVTLNERQLRLISRCVEDCSRFMGGQTEMWNTTSLLANCNEIQNKLNSEIERAQTQEQTLSSNINELLNSNDTVKLKKLIDKGEEQ